MVAARVHKASTLAPTSDSMQLMFPRQHARLQTISAGSTHTAAQQAWADLDAAAELEQQLCLQQVRVFHVFDAYTLLGLLEKLSPRPFRAQDSLDAHPRSGDVATAASAPAAASGAVSHFRSSLSTAPWTSTSTAPACRGEESGGRRADRVAILIDCLSPLLLPVLGHTKHMAGHAIMFEIGRALHRVACANSTLAIVTNTAQVDTGRGKGSADIGRGKGSEVHSGGLRASLGQAWPCIPGTRLMLEPMLAVEAPSLAVTHAMSRSTSIPRKSAITLDLSITTLQSTAASPALVRFDRRFKNALCGRRSFLT